MTCMSLINRFTSGITSTGIAKSSCMVSSIRRVGRLADAAIFATILLGTFITGGNPVPCVATSSFTLFPTSVIRPCRISCSTFTALNLSSVDGRVPSSSSCAVSFACAPAAATRAFRLAALSFINLANSPAHICALRRSSRSVMLSCCVPLSSSSNCCRPIVGVDANSS